MYAAAEADMPDGAAGDVVLVRVLPMARVAIGGTQKHQHLFPFIDRDSADFDGARRGAKKGLHRALIAYRFFECGAGQ
jgi:hypothetical protein